MTTRDAVEAGREDGAQPRGPLGLDEPGEHLRHRDGVERPQGGEEPALLLGDERALGRGAAHGESLLPEERPEPHSGRTEIRRSTCRTLFLGRMIALGAPASSAAQATASADSLARLARIWRSTASASVRSPHVGADASARDARTPRAATVRASPAAAVRSASAAAVRSASAAAVRSASAAVRSASAPAARTPAPVVHSASRRGGRGAAAAAASGGRSRAAGGRTPNAHDLAAGTIIAGRYKVQRCSGAAGWAPCTWCSTSTRASSSRSRCWTPRSPTTRRRSSASRTEARAPVRIGTDHVVRIFDADVSAESATCPSWSWSCSTGATSAELKRRGVLPAGEVVLYLRQVARALDKAHAHRHRPPRSQAREPLPDRARRRHPLINILDFGIAKLTDGMSAKMTQDGTIFGTPWYMSPEQARGHASKVGPPADLWALGLIAFRLLTGQNYGPPRAWPALIGQIVYDPMPPPSQIAPHLGPCFDAWFARACSREQDQRFPTATELVLGLAEAIGIRGPPAQRHLRRFRRAAPPPGPVPGVPAGRLSPSPPRNRGCPHLHPSPCRRPEPGPMSASQPGGMSASSLGGMAASRPLHPGPLSSSGMPGGMSSSQRSRADARLPGAMAQPFPGGMSAVARPDAACPRARGRPDAAMFSRVSGSRAPAFPGPTPQPPLRGCRPPFAMGVTRAKVPLPAGCPARRPRRSSRTTPRPLARGEPRPKRASGASAAMAVGGRRGASRWWREPRGWRQRKKMTDLGIQSKGGGRRGPAP